VLHQLRRECYDEAKGFVGRHLTRRGNLSFRADGGGGGRAGRFLGEGGRGTDAGRGRGHGRTVMGGGVPVGMGRREHYRR